jgi:glutamate N-acetyltransferase / amino-acid N-acetyltransferase
MKPDGGADLAILVSDAPAAVAGVFTRNSVVAAPVIVSRAQIGSGTSRAVVTNSGLANACTGAGGLSDAWAMVDATAGALALPRDQVLVASTGVIGPRLPMPAVTSAIGRAAGSLSAGGGEAAAEAIRTTDAFAKVAAVETTIGGGSVRVGGMAKGAGMIRPDMATTLAQITTDAAIDPELLQSMLVDAMGDSFNAISVDGCTSTNDCVFVLANGASGVNVESTAEVAQLTEAVAEVALDLAKQVVRDGEGATRVCTYAVSGAMDDEQADTAARAVAENVLVKCALHGADPNWGRMLAALGASGIELDPGRIEVAVGGVGIVSGGIGSGVPDSDARAAFAHPDVAVAIDLGMGSGRAKVIASDLSPSYVHFNAGVTS